MATPRESLSRCRSLQKSTPGECQGSSARVFIATDLGDNANNLEKLQAMLKANPIEA
jgi:hypothetical protein